MFSTLLTLSLIPTLCLSETLKLVNLLAHEHYPDGTTIQYLTLLLQGCDRKRAPEMCWNVWPRDVLTARPAIDYHRVR